jgi:hypothetical protein
MSYNLSNIISNIIYYLHLLLVTIVFISIFINNKKIKIITFVFLIYLMLQYITGYEKCGLTELEYYFKGKDYEEGFLYRLIKPVIRTPEKYFYKNLYIAHAIWIIVLAYQLDFIALINKIK